MKINYRQLFPHQLTPGDIIRSYNARMGLMRDGIFDVVLSVSFYNPKLTEIIAIRNDGQVHHDFFSNDNSFVIYIRDRKANHVEE